MQQVDRLVAVFLCHFYTPHPIRYNTHVQAHYWGRLMSKLALCDEIITHLKQIHPTVNLDQADDDAIKEAILAHSVNASAVALVKTQEFRLGMLYGLSLADSGGI